MHAIYLQTFHEVMLGKADEFLQYLGLARLLRRVVASEGSPAGSKPGDSSVLLFIASEGTLFPIGIHNKGSKGLFGNAIPLWVIFANFGQELYAPYISPKLSKVCAFNPIDFGPPQYECFEGSQCQLVQLIQRR